MQDNTPISIADLDKLITSMTERYNAIPDPTAQKTAMFAQVHAERFRRSRDAADARQALELLRSISSLAIPDREDPSYEPTQKARFVTYELVLPSTETRPEDRDDLDDLIEALADADDVPHAVGIFRGLRRLEVLSKELPNGDEQTIVGAVEIVEQTVNFAFAETFEESPIAWQIRVAHGAIDFYNAAASYWSHPDADALAPSLTLLISNLQQSHNNPPATSDLDQQIALATLLTQLVEIVSKIEQSIPKLRQAASIIDSALPMTPGASPLNAIAASSTSLRINQTLKNDTSVAQNHLLHACNRMNLEYAESRSPALNSEGIVRAHIGEVAVTALSMRDQAWSLIALDTGQDVTDLAAKEEVLEDYENLSSTVVSVFLAQGQRRCVAATVKDGVWASVDLPDLAQSAFGICLREAHDAHADRSERAGRDRWREVVRPGFCEQLRHAIRPLAVHLARADRVALHVSGWCHAMPIAPVLASEIETGAVVAIPLTRRQTTPGSSTFVGIAYAGPASDPLPNVQDDVNDAAARFIDPIVLVAPERDQALAALSESGVALLAGHAFASPGNAITAYFDLERDGIAVMDILNLDLSCCDVLVFAACESLGFDRLLPSSRLSLTTAAVLAGASGAIGSHWRLSDDEARLFTNDFFEDVADGTIFCEAYRSAARRIQTDSLTLYVDHARRLAPLVN